MGLGLHLKQAKKRSPAQPMVNLHKFASCPYYIRKRLDFGVLDIGVIGHSQKELHGGRNILCYKSLIQ